jgi:ATP-dependent Clp protease ATP-binding subunit ClpA
MFERLDTDARRAVMDAAQEEVQRRGDRRVGTDHLLLGLLHDAHSPASESLGVDLQAARAATDALDRAALASVGVDPGGHALPTGITARRHARLSSGARAVLEQSLERAREAGSRHIDAGHLLLALLACQRPDRVAELLDALGVDRDAVRDRLQRP